MTRKIINGLMIAMIILVALCLIPVLGDIFRSHMLFFLFLWLFLPAVVLWLG